MYVRALQKAGMVTQEECQAIVKGLDTVSVDGGFNTGGGGGGICETIKDLSYTKLNYLAIFAVN